jgi:hypothetical protein
MEEILKAVNALCEELATFAYFSELPKSKGLVRAAEHLQELITAQLSANEPLVIRNSNETGLDVE